MTLVDIEKGIHVWIVAIVNSCKLTVFLCSSASTILAGMKCKQSAMIIKTSLNSWIPDALNALCIIWTASLCIIFLYEKLTLECLKWTALEKVEYAWKNMWKMKMWKMLSKKKEKERQKRRIWKFLIVNTMMKQTWIEWLSSFLTSAPRLVQCEKMYGNESEWWVSSGRQKTEHLIEIDERNETQLSSLFCDLNNLYWFYLQLFTPLPCSNIEIFCRCFYSCCEERYKTNRNHINTR